MIQIKRIYTVAEASDGYRILVDRLWPRGIKKELSGVDLWAADLAPSASLRKWFNHEPGKFNDFKVKYLQELKENEAVAIFLKKIEQQPIVTLLYGAKDEQHNQAIVLLDFLQKKLKA